MFLHFISNLPILTSIHSKELSYTIVSVSDLIECELRVLVVTHFLLYLIFDNGPLFL